MNSVVLTGRLTKNPEMKYLAESDKAVAHFTLAVDRPFSKEKQADFLRIVVFGKQAENCERFLEKGRLVGVQGRIQTGSYITKTGEMKYTTDIAAERVEFLGGRNDSQADSKYLAESGVPEGFQQIDDDEIPF